MTELISIDRINSKQFIDYISCAISVDCEGYAYHPQPTFGAENENYFLGVNTKGGVIELVLRCKPHICSQWREGYGEDYIQKEYHALKEFQRLDIGYNTANVWALTHGGLLDTDYFLMERLRGSILYWGFKPEYSAQLIENYARAVGRLSNIPLDMSDTLTKRLPEFSMQDKFVLTVKKAMHKYSHNHLMNYALAWLKQHFPAPREKVICHGDLNPSNILTDGDEICGIIDWENIHISDDSLNQLTSIGWIYDRDDLIDTFCHYFQRTREEFHWHLVWWYFTNAFNYNDIGSWEEYNRERLIKEVEYSG